jgi:alpha-L-rhamnosidase
MKKHLAYVQQHAKNHILNLGLGDWLAPTSELETMKGNAIEGPALVSTAYYYKMVHTLSSMANELGHIADQQQLDALAKQIKDAFNEHFYDKHRRIYKTKQYDGFRQTNQIMPLIFDLVPESERQIVLQQLVDDIVISCNRHLNTGIIGTKYLLQLLTENGYIDLAYDIVNQTTYPSWGYWIEKGATSLWEAWELAARSRNHHMFGSVDDWFFKYLAGVTPATPGYHTVQIKPFVPSELNEVKTELEVPAGTVLVHWMKEDQIKLNMRVQIPPNTSAMIYVPKLTLRAISVLEKISSKTITLLSENESYFIYQAASGSYHFRTNAIE